MSRLRKQRNLKRKEKEVYPYNLSRFLAFLSTAEHTGEGNSVRLGDIFLPL